MKPRVVLALTLAAHLGAWAGPAAAQLWDPRALEGDAASATGPLAPRLSGLGSAAYPVTTTTNADSQAFYTQGMNLVWAFNHSEAVRAFRESARLDPDNAMAYWGQALALGPNLNLPMQPEAIDPAIAAMSKAQALKARASPVEQALIDALATRYSSEPEADRAALDAAYAAAMRDMAARYPDDPGVVTLYADALMNLSPWNFWTRDGQPRESTPEILRSLETALDQDPDHAGALHLLIHAVEARYPERAEEAADRLAPLMSSAGHLVHMPSHIYMQVGRYADAYAVNVAAAAADESYLEQCRAQGIYPLLYYPHNLHFMVWAAMFEGRSKVALTDARKMAEHNHLENELFGLPELFELQPLFVLARFGRWDEVLAEARPPAQARLMNALWHYARGLAFQHRGDRRRAETELKALRAIAAEPGLAEQYTAFAPTLTLVTIAEQILAAEIAAGRGRHDEAIARLTRAMSLQDGLAYNEPPEWFFPVRHYLGAMLVEASYPREAEAIYWQDLEKHRENGYALFGLGQALAAAGRPEEAAAMMARYRQAWTRADHELRTSRY